MTLREQHEECAERYRIALATYRAACIRGDRYAAAVAAQDAQEAFDEANAIYCRAMRQQQR